MTDRPDQPGADEQPDDSRSADTRPVDAGPGDAGPDDAGAARASDYGASAASPGGPPGREGAPAPAPAGGPGEARGRHREAFEVGAQLRALRADLDTVRADLAALSTARTTDRAHLSEASGWLSELLPRVEDLEATITELAARLPPRSGETGHGGDTPADDQPVPTPAIGWDDMDHDTARAAWEALARFVGEVLHAQYRLTRLQVPDCWPLHPRLVRELAWLRSTYVVAGGDEADMPAGAGPWHMRALPIFLSNMVDAIDPRECRPGIHRLTEPEVEHHLGQLTEAHHQGRRAPPVSADTGPERPRLRPEAFPRRGTAPSRPGAESNPPAVRTLPDLVSGSCDPRFWLDYYREASAADLERRATSPAQDTTRGEHDRGDDPGNGRADDFADDDGEASW